MVEKMNANGEKNGMVEKRRKCDRQCDHEKRKRRQCDQKKVAAWLKKKTGHGRK